MFLQRTVVAAGDSFAITDVGFAVSGPLVDTQPASIAEVRGILDSAFTVLLKADGAIHPFTASTRTVAGAVQQAGAGIFGTTVTKRVFAHRHFGAKAVAIAHLTEATFGFRVGATGVTRASPFRVSKTTALAPVITGVVAAVPVDAEVRETFEAIEARIADVLLGYADLPFTVEVGLAIRLVLTREEAVRAVGVADVRSAVQVLRIRASAQAVAEVHGVLEVARARLVETDGAGIPETAGKATVASAVQTTAGFRFLGTFIFGVGAVGRRLATTCAVADAAQPTFPFGVDVILVCHATTRILG